MPANPTARIRSVLAHLTSLNYTPHAFFIDLLASQEPDFAQAQESVRAKAALLVPHLVYPGHSRLSAALLCLRVIELPVHEFITLFLGSRESAHALARADVQKRVGDICSLLLPGGNRARLSTAVICLKCLRMTVSELCLKALAPANAELHADMLSAVPALLDALQTLALPIVTRWAMDFARNEYGRELLRTTEKSAGFHGVVTDLKADDVEAFSIPSLAEKLQSLAPYLWELLSHLVDADPRSRRALGSGDAEELVLNCVGDLGASGAQIILNPAPSDSQDEVMDTSGDAAASSAGAGNTVKPRINAAMQRNNALKEIKVVTMFGIAQQGTNQRCNALQSNMGVFLRLTRAPDILIQVLNHIGISVSNSSIENACDSLDLCCIARLAAMGPSLLAQLVYDNYNFMERVAVPTLDDQSAFISATSALLILSHPSIVREQFRHAIYMWWRNSANEVPRFFPFPPPFLPTFDQILDLPLRLDSRHARAGFDPQEDQIDTIATHAARMLVQHGRFFSVYRPFLDEPPAVSPIPLHKTEYMPFRAMDLNQATVSGNIEAIESMMRQMNFPADKAEEYVTLVHADLGGVERLQGAQAQRCDEDTGSAQLRNVVTCPGLFHVSLANADILFRTHLNPDARLEDESCLWKYICKLRPTKAERAKFTAKQGPGYRRMHDVAKHVTWALILECWELESQAWDASCTTLEAFAERLSRLPTRKSAWNRIRAIARTIALKYVAGPDFQAARARPVAQRDGQFENWQLFLQISFFDQIFDYAVKTQDVGRVLLSLCDLIFAYQGAKKHKYAFQLMKTLVMLAYVCPEPLRDAFLTSWIINPTGKPMGGRGVDWLNELFNLYLKMHCGSSSNYGLEHMMDTSRLISLFKHVFDNFIINYHITSHTTRHQGPNMQETIDELRKVIHSDRAMIFTPGRTSKYEVDDVMTLGLAKFMSGTAAELAAQDVEAERTPTLIEDYD